MKSTFVPFMLGAGMVLGFYYIKSNKSKFDKFVKEVQDCSNKIMNEFKGSNNCGRSQSGMGC